MHVFGVLRIKNEARWIADVISSIQRLCERILVFDDHSIDETPQICRSFGPQVTVYDSPFQGLDESRDKDWLLARALEAVPERDQHYLGGNPGSPYWALAIDGDEILEKPGPGIIAQTLANAAGHAWSLRIQYLWDTPDRIRIDGVYGTFARPSLFRLMNRAFRYQRTPWGNGANFHCSSIPQELLHNAQPCPARLWHMGYLHREDRLRKFAWYNSIDPNNATEDRYRHIVQGDVPEVPAGAKLLWAGPLRFGPREE